MKNDKDADMTNLWSGLHEGETDTPASEVKDNTKNYQATINKILEIIQLINSELNIGRVLDLAAYKIIDIFEAERVFIISIKPKDKLEFRVAIHYAGGPIYKPEREVSSSIVLDVAHKRKALLVEDATQDPRFAEISSVRNLQLHSVMVAPLLAQNELLGVVYVDNREFSGKFTRPMCDLLEIFSSHVGIALRNAQLFENLQKARKELALAERLRTIGEVAAYVAHEVKNPLTSIRFFTDDLAERWMDKEFRKQMLKVVPQQVARLNDVVSQVLDYSRPSELVKVPVEVTELIQSALRTLDGEIRQKKVQVRTQFQEDIPPVHADGQKLQEVFVNLIKNSLEAMEAMIDRSHKEVLVIVQRNEDFVETIVADTGPGIPSEELPKIFEPFHTGKKHGSGLGLALCQKVVREHGGDITAENAPSGGARFCVRIPLAGT